MSNHQFRITLRLNSGFTQKVLPEGQANYRFPSTRSPSLQQVSVQVLRAGNYKFPIKKLKFIPWNLASGFTLIEILVVLGILTVTVGSSLLVLTGVLKGSNQASVNAEVKQNGQAVLDSLEAQIRNAKDVQCFNLAGSTVDCLSGNPVLDHIKLTSIANLPLHIKCFSTAAENGWIGTATQASPMDSDYVTLTNRDLISGADVGSCSFRVFKEGTGGSNPPIVSTSFVLNQGVRAPSRVDFQANVKFETTISLRQY